MSEGQKRQLETQLCGIANLLWGKISADDYRNYNLGFILHKYLSEEQNIFANNLLETENIREYIQLTDPELLTAVKEESPEKLGYFQVYQTVIKNIIFQKA